jgi:hypothetical protein
MRFDLEVRPEVRAIESDSLPPIGGPIFVEDRTGKTSLQVYAHERHISGGELKVLVRTRAIPPVLPATPMRPAYLPAEPTHWADKALAMLDRLG